MKGKRMLCIPPWLPHTENWNRDSVTEKQGMRLHHMAQLSIVPDFFVWLLYTALLTNEALVQFFNFFLNLE